MRIAFVLMALCAAAEAAEPAAAVERARAALQALDFAGAARVARAAISAGGARSEELVELYAILGEAASIAEGADAGERAFRVELALAPAHAPPVRASPVVAEQFRRARDWVLAHGTLHASHVVAVAPHGGGYRVRARVDGDPLAMVARSQLWYRQAGNAYVAATLDADGFVVPLGPGVIEYWIVFLDASGNQLLGIGDPAAPLQLVAAEAARRAPHRPLRTAAIAVGAAGVALLVTGIALNVIYAGDYAHLQQVCGSSCQPGQLSRLDVDRGISIAGYAGGAGLVLTAGVLFVIDAAQARRSADEPRSELPRPLEPPRR